MTLFGRPRPTPAPVAPRPETAGESQLADLKGRHAHALAIVATALIRQSGLHPDDRNDDLMDVCLEVRLALHPIPVTKTQGAMPA